MRYRVSPLSALVAVVCLASGWFLFTTATHISRYRQGAAPSESEQSVEPHSASKCIPIGSSMPDINLNVPSMPKGELVINPHFLEHLKALPEIPRKLHLAWNDRGVMQSETPLAKRGIRNLTNLNPDWELDFAEDADMDAYLKAHLPAEDWKLLQPQHVVERVDVWRLLVVYHEGGFYQDIDRLYNRPMTEILKPNTKMLLPVSGDVNFSQDIMCSAPCNDIHRAALELNLQRRRAFSRRKTPKQARRFNRTRKEILSMGPEAYFNAATFVLFGQMLAYDRDVVKRIYKIVQSCPYIETQTESRCSSITYADDGACADIPRNQLHQKQNRSKWMDDI